MPRKIFHVSAAVSLCDKAVFLLVKCFLKDDPDHTWSLSKTQVGASTHSHSKYVSLWLYLEALV